MYTRKQNSRLIQTWKFRIKTTKTSKKHLNCHHLIIRTKPPFLTLSTKLSFNMFLLTGLNIPSSSGSPNGLKWFGRMSSSGSSKGLVLMAVGASWSSSSRKFSLLISSVATKSDTKSYTRTTIMKKSNSCRVKRVQVQIHFPKLNEYKRSQNQIYQYLHFGVNHEQEDHSVLLGSSVLLCNLCSTLMHVQQWHSGKICVWKCVCYGGLLWETVKAV